MEISLSLFQFTAVILGSFAAGQLFSILFSKGLAKRLALASTVSASAVIILVAGLITAITTYLS